MLFSFPKENLICVFMKNKVGSLYVLLANYRLY